jgi:hypothetical protein
MHDFNDLIEDVKDYEQRLGKFDENIQRRLKILKRLIGLNRLIPAHHKEGAGIQSVIRMM